jgi:hypothetical protein
MAAFTVHIPNAAGATVAPDKIVFLRDGFSWGAFLFGPFWLAWRRAWLAAFLWTAALALIAFAGAKLGLPSSMASVIGFALALALGYEGTRVVAWTLVRKGYAESDVIIGDDLDEAEEVFFRRWRAPQSDPPAGPSGEAPSA